MPSESSSASVARQPVAAPVVKLGGGDVERDRDLLARREPGAFDRPHQRIERRLVGLERRPEPALVGHPLQQTAFRHDRAGRAIHLGGPFERLIERGRERRDDHEILDIDPPPGMRAAAENLDFRQRHHRLGAVAEQIGIKRLSVRGGGGVQRGHRYRDQRIAAEPAFLRRAVERDQRAVDRGLVGGVHARSARRRSRR